MGIDVYLHWDGQTKAEEEKQYTGYSVTSGHVGYLREAYHGEPYVTIFLFGPEWDDDAKLSEGLVIKNADLVSRLPKALVIANQRNAKLYHGSQQEGVLKSFEDFVALHGRLEKEGKHPRIVISA